MSAHNLEMYYKCLKIEGTPGCSIKSNDSSMSKNIIFIMTFGNWVDGELRAISLISAYPRRYTLIRYMKNEGKYSLNGYPT